MATKKQVTIIARYAHKTNGKLNGTVTYLVRSSDDKSEYCTTIVEGKASGCSCPSVSKKGCYHKTQLEAKEAGRPFAAKSLPVWTVKLVESGKLVAPKAAKIAKEVGITVAQVQELAEIAIELRQDTKHTPLCLPIGPRDTKKDISTKGNLNGSRAFSLMR